MGKERKVCSSALKAMANVHHWHWTSNNDRLDEFTDSSDFWAEQVRMETPITGLI